jgi:hypothetical protein
MLERQRITGVEGYEVCREQTKSMSASVKKANQDKPLGALVVILWPANRVAKVIVQHEEPDFEISGHL